MGRPRTLYATLDDDQLAEALLEWFLHHAGRRDRWNRTATGRLLKGAMQALGSFKHLPRGDPAKGHRTLLKQVGCERVCWRDSARRRA